MNRCERCETAYPQAGILAGRCPRCLVELGLTPALAFEDDEIVLTALADEALSMVGRRIAHYEVLALLGAGGMGAVWKAKDTMLGRDVALKTLPPHFECDASALARVELEAKLLASLNHPNIAAIHGLGEDGDKRFLVLEFVEGETLADRLRRGAIPLDESLRIARQISDALEAAHEKGIIHRDLKPANIQITEDGAVKVLDFGLAKVQDTLPKPGIEATAPQMIMGTAAYMAPEQARGRKVDRRADIWAFGVVLYEMVTGTRPFRGADSDETIASNLTKEPDLDSVPVEVRRLIRRCLEKEPKNRLRDIGDAWDLLDPFPVMSAAANRHVEQRNTSLRWIFASVALGIVSLVFSLLLLKPLPLPEVVRFEVNAPPGGLLPLGTPAISDDGSTLVSAVLDSDGKTRLYSYSFQSGEPEALRGTEGATHPFWSADGKSLAFSTGLAIKKIDLETGAVRTLRSQTTGRWQGAWSVNDTILVRGGPGLLRLSVEGDDPQPVPNSDGLSFPTFLSDGRRFLARLDTGKVGSIQLASLDSPKRTLVVNNVRSAPILARTPGGKTYLFFLDGSNLMVQEFDEASEKVLGDPKLFIPGIGRVDPNDLLPALAVSPSGHLAYQSSNVATVRQLRWVNRKGETIQTLSPDESVGNPRLSPNVKMIAGVRNREVYVTDLDRRPADRKTYEGNVGNNVAWSPDSSQVAFLRQDGIYAIDMHGGNPRRLTQMPGHPTSWSREYLAYTSPPYVEQGRIYLLSLAELSKSIQAGSIQGNSVAGEISPDGRFLAFSSMKSGSYEVYVQRMPSMEERPVSSGGGGLPRWRRDGKELFFISRDGYLMAVNIQLGDELSIGRPQKLFPLGSRDGIQAAEKGYDVSRDGHRFLIPVKTEEFDAPINVVRNWWVELERKTER